RVSDFEGNSINLDNIYYISNEIADKNKKVRLKPYDVVITTVGATAGNFIRVPIEADGYLLNQNTVRLRTKENNKWDQIYLFYALKYKNFQEFLLLGAQGSAQPSIVLDQILDAEIAYPDNRRETAKKLFSIDQKIHLNTQINQTLEQIAQALFKSWFVDFDPVRAKVQALSDGLSLEQAELAAMQAISGKTPKELTALSQTQPDRYAELAETAKAFPCEMVEVDGVEVPKGWKIQYLKDICNIVYGKNLPTTKLIKEGYPVFGGNGVIGYYDKFLYETPQTLVSCRGAASGKVLYSLSYSFVTNNSLVIEHEKSGLSYFYIYETLKLQNLTELTSGSAQPQMTIANMAAVQILVPSEKINEVCKKYLGTLYNQIYQNNIENETLANTRDLLLPKLLKGEV
ncbi:restriction endonuclease subunit S, partial [Haemophilus influenzae]|uniref:restriction endonuclease subunit S n=1 Tax=Haemophilus influenzae TaxID=727 RepID=UPI0019550CFF